MEEKTFYEVKREAIVHCFMEWLQSKDAEEVEVLVDRLASEVGCSSEILEGVSAGKEWMQREVNVNNFTNSGLKVHPPNRLYTNIGRLLCDDGIKRTFQAVEYLDEAGGVRYALQLEGSDEELELSRCTSIDDAAQVPFKVFEDKFEFLYTPEVIGYFRGETVVAVYCLFFLGVYVGGKKLGLNVFSSLEQCKRACYAAWGLEFIPEKKKVLKSLRQTEKDRDI
jgi:hypothetical protein